MATKQQIIQIHTLRSKLALTEEEYRTMLASFGVESSVDLDEAQARKLVDALNAHAPKWAPIAEREHVGKRLGMMATSDQVNMIEAMWHVTSRVKDPVERRKALDVFIHRRFHRGGLMMVERALVHKIVRALRAMQKQKKDSNETEESHA